MHPKLRAIDGGFAIGERVYIKKAEDHPDQEDKRATFKLLTSHGIGPFTVVPATERERAFGHCPNTHIALIDVNGRRCFLPLTFLQRNDPRKSK